MTGYARDPRLWGFMLAATVLMVAGCKQPSEFDMLASRFSMAAENLETQKVETLVALQDAAAAQQVAVTQPEFSFRSPETLEFVQSWQYAGNQVAALRSQVTTTVNSCYEMLDGLRVRAESINDQLIRTKTIEYVEQRRQEFDQAVQQTNEAINNMENALRLGNDIIESLRIVGTANLVSAKIDELRTLQQEAIDSFPSVDNIIEEGKKFLNIEFGEEVFI